MTRPAAVVFDCDGVLVDSEPHSVVAWLVVLAELHHPAGPVDVERCQGLVEKSLQALDLPFKLPNVQLNAVIWPVERGGMVPGA